jgi:hypothetical protein
MSGNTVNIGPNSSGNAVNAGHHNEASAAPTQEPRSASASSRGLAERIGFGMDIVSYSWRLPAHFGFLQERLVTLVDGVLADVGIADADSDRGEGDDKMVFLQAGGDPTQILPRLLRAFAPRLAADNARYTDRLRVRLAVASGLVDRGPNGFVGALPTLLGRLLGGDVLREAVAAYPDADVVAIVSDHLHGSVVGGGYVPALAAKFRAVHVTAKQFAAKAWLWAPGGA